MKLELEFPPSELLVNRRDHWKKYRPVVKRCRQDACYLAMAENESPVQFARVHYDFYFPNNLPRDLANYIHMCKPYVDGVVDSGYLPNDSWQYLRMGHVEPHIDADKPRVVLTFEAIKFEGAD